MKIQSVDIPYFSLGYLELPEKNLATHEKVLPWLSVVQATEGRYGVCLGNRENGSVEQGSFFIAPSGVQQRIVHYADPSTGMMKARWLFIEVLLNKSVPADHVCNFPLIVQEESAGRLNRIFDELFSCGDLFGRYACCYRILRELFDLSDTQDGYLNEDARRIWEYIQNHYKEPVRIEDLAEQFHMSVSGFHATFRKMFGIPPITYINKLRIAAAAEMLKNTDESIAAVAAAVGIRDPYYFNKLFHKNYSASPREYRLSIRNDAVNGSP